LCAGGLQNALRAAPRLIYGAWTGKGSNARGEEAPSDDLGSGVGSARKTKAALSVWSPPPLICAAEARHQHNTTASLPDARPRIADIPTKLAYSSSRRVVPPPRHVPRL